MNKEYYDEIEENKGENPRIILPSEIEREKKERKKKLSPYFKTIKYTSIISILFLIYLFYQPILLYFTSLLKANPTIFSNYLFIKAQIANNTIFGLFFMGFFGSLFFLALPSEAIFIYFLDSTNHNFIIIILIMIIGNTMGLIFNYGFGRILGKRVIRFMFKKNFFKYKEKIDKFGGLILFFGNIFPGPVEILSIFYGAFKFDFKRYVFLSFMGRMIKYILLFLAFFFFWDQIIYVIDEIKGAFGF